MPTAKRILITDDDQELCEEAADALRDAGHLTQTAYDGKTGCDYINKNSYDAIILDYKMTGLTGVDILKFIKRKNLAVKVFLVSGRPFIEKQLKEENVMGLVTRILNKPFDIARLLEEINTP